MEQEMIDRVAIIAEILKKETEKSGGYINDNILGVEATRLASQHSRPVAMCDKETGKLIRVFVSAHEAGRVTGVFHSQITYHCKNTNRSSKGNYNWRYATLADVK